MRFTIDGKPIKWSVAEWAILLGVPTFLCILFTLLLNMRPMFRAEATVVQNQSTVMGIRGRHLRQAGFSLQAVKLIRAQARHKENLSLMSIEGKRAMLKSNDLLIGFIREKSIKPKLYRGLWDRNLNKWKERKPSRLKIWSDKEKGRARSAEPSDYLAAEKLKKKIRIKEKNGIIKISVKWRNPDEAAQLANNFITYANKYIDRRERVSIKSEIERIEALLKRNDLTLASHAVLENKRSSSLYALEARLPKSATTFDVLDPAHPPIKPELKLPIALLIVVFTVAICLVFVTLIIRRASAAKV